jgi:quercetin dioxygenase-like cupin family protein
VEWIAYVLEGNGQLLLADAAGKQTGVVNFKKGDYMIFRADTMHGWKGGTAEAQLLFVTPTKK